MASSILEPKSQRYGDADVFSVVIEPDDPFLLIKLEEAEQESKELASKMVYKTMDYDYQVDSLRPSKMIDGCGLRFESRYSPRLSADLCDIYNENEFLHKRVQICAVPTTLKDGNMYLSMNIIETVEVIQSEEDWTLELATADNDF
jgi:hypothetical protein